MSNQIQDQNSHFFIIQNEMLDKWIRVIGIGPFTIYCLLKRMCVGQNDMPFPNVKQQDWAEYIGMSLSSFRRHLETLETFGLVDIINPKGHEKLTHKPIKYVINNLGEVELKEKDYPEPLSEKNSYNDQVYQPNSSVFKKYKSDLVNLTKSAKSNLPSQVYKTVNNIRQYKKHIVSEKNVSEDVSGKDDNVKRTKERTSPETIKACSLLTKKLKSIVETNFGRTLPKNINTSSWTTQFRLLHEKDGIPISKINEVMEWYEEYAGMEYIPECQSGGSFRTKFNKLEMALHRTTKQTKRKRKRTGASNIPGKYDGMLDQKIKVEKKRN